MKMRGRFPGYVFLTVMVLAASCGNSEPPELKFAAKTAEGWSEPQTIVQSDDLIVNYADFPSLLAYGQGRLALRACHSSHPEPSQASG